MKNEDRLFELYKIYIPLMYDYNRGFYGHKKKNLREIKWDALDQAEKALEYFNRKLKEEE